MNTSARTSSMPHQCPDSPFRVSAFPTCAAVVPALPVSPAEESAIWRCPCNVMLSPGKACWFEFDAYFACALQLLVELLRKPGLRAPIHPRSDFRANAGNDQGNPSRLPPSRVFCRCLEASSGNASRSQPSSSKFAANVQHSDLHDVAHGQEAGASVPPVSALSKHPCPKWRPVQLCRP